MLKRVGHGVSRQMRKVQGFFTFYGGKLRDYWKGDGLKGSNRVRRAAVVLVGGVFVFSLWWVWSARTRVLNTPTDTPLIVAPATDAKADAKSAPVESRREEAAVQVSVHPLPPPEPRAPRPTVVVESLTRPVAATAAEPPGWRRAGRTGYWHFDPAVRLYAPAGSAVQAALPGTVTSIVSSADGGVELSLQHDGGLRTVYSNVYDVAVAVGNNVSVHTRLGRLRPPSDSEETEESITFTVYRDDEPLDVLSLLNLP